jgi:hypothetical protein
MAVAGTWVGGGVDEASMAGVPVHALKRKKITTMKFFIRGNYMPTPSLKPPSRRRLMSNPSAGDGAGSISYGVAPTKFRAYSASS